MQNWMEQIRQILSPEQIKEQEPMAKHTTFRVGGPADVLVTPDEKNLMQVIAVARSQKIPVTVIGNGSNLLVGDGGIRGLVVEIGQGMDFIEIQGKSMKVGAGTILSKAANAAAKAGLSGLEFASGIPGSLGGAIVMNAGAYGSEMKNVLEKVTVLTRDGEIRTLDAEALDLGYRHSCIPKEQMIVLSAVLELEQEDREKIHAYMAELREKRISKQPLEYPSAGSTFQRPQGYFAGKLIEDAGLRGYRVGDAQVSEKHCGFVINRGNATAAEICQLMKDVQQKVREQFGVELQPEVRMIGEF